jgi:serine phosphatase RsbU (regulator of sigma subunit)
VLGVLLVEEPDPTPTLSFGVSGANYRLRERRMEIITGISQQAALAIQNDHLQSEMVTRERLEREMQLAREIQRTFLPQHLPDLPFWDIKVRWRPAREVGGDFYDFFNLPDGRLGMVIADVADKGMPAALFMTLVRTLVRATVQETASPTEVLARVNDVLVPDAPQGMFVTLVYAILSPETGELEYANAGHNLPLILRESTCTLEHLKPGGMALGVLEGNQLKGFQVSLEPGDFLILYTDGITEAFSPQGELYDEDRLCHTIREAAVSFAAENSLTSNTALDMLNAIDESVTDFIGDSPPSDDLTLVVLKRTAE